MSFFRSIFTLLLNQIEFGTLAENARVPFFEHKIDGNKKYLLLDLSERVITCSFLTNNEILWGSMGCVLRCAMGIFHYNENDFTFGYL